MINLGIIWEKHQEILSQVKLEQQKLLWKILRFKF